MKYSISLTSKGLYKLGYGGDRDVKYPKGSDNGLFTLPEGDRYKMLGILGLAAFLRFFRIGQQSYWVDEVQSIWQVNGYAGTILDNLLHNFQGPIHSAMLLGWSKLGGWSATWTRSLSAIIALITIWFFYVLARKLTGRRAALWAAILLAVSPFHVWYSQETRNYILLHLLVVLSMIFFIRIIENSTADKTSRSSLRRRRLGIWIAFFLISVAALVCNLAALFLFAFQGIYALVVRPKIFWKLLLVLLIIILLLFPWIKNVVLDLRLDNILHAPPLRKINYHPLAIPYTFMVYSVGATVGPTLNEMNQSLTFDLFKPFIPYFIIASITYVILILKGLKPWLDQRKMLWFFLMWMFIPMIIVGVLAIMNLKIYQVRYTSVGFPAYLIILAVGFERCKKQLRWVLVAIVVFLTFVSLRNIYTNPRYWKPDARAAVQKIIREAHREDAIIVYSIQEPFRYYYNGPIEIMGIWSNPGSKQFRENMDYLERQFERIWLVNYFGWYLDPKEKIPEVFDEQFKLADEQHFVGIDVRLYRNPRSLR